MTVIYPDATAVQGNTKIKAVLAVSNTASPSLATEINAASSLDLSCFVRDFNPEVSANSGNAPARLCTVLVLPQEGTVNLSAVEIRYVYSPQGAGTVNENKARTLLTRGLVFYIVERRGLDAQNTAFAAAQLARVWKFRAGYQNETRSGDDEFAEFEVSQMLFPLAPPVNATIAA